MSRRSKQPTRAIQKFIQKLFVQIWKFSRSVAQGTIQWLLRSLMVSRRRHRRTAAGTAGFVLPTVVLLLLVVALVVATLMFRTINRTKEVIGQGQTQVIYNAATPAIERAKAKLEYLFTSDSRRPSGIPSEDILASMMLNNNTNGIVQVSGDPYKLPDEEWLNLDNGTKTTAWKYRVDLDEDGVVSPTPDPNSGDATVSYAIVWKIINADGSVRIDDPDRNPSEQDKARALVVRNGPLSASEENLNCTQIQGSPIEKGWFRDKYSEAKLRKSFQITALVIPDRPTGTVATLELQQERQVDRGNKWGAWFRTDLEIFPGGSGDPFRWNGAMHTEGSLFLGDTNVDRFVAYLVSSKKSCLYTPDASEITVTSVPGGVEPAFRGHIVSGGLRSGGILNNIAARFHLYKGPATDPITTGTDVQLTSVTDSVKDGYTNAGDIALNPEEVFTEARYKGYRAADGTNNNAKYDTNWDNTSFSKYKRIIQRQEQKPYVDDTYRADDRYGPKPSYGIEPDLQWDPGTKVGDVISTAKTRLISNTPLDNDPVKIGLDGYWERRARREGLRVIVGQRLELESLKAPNSTELTTLSTNPRRHEALQRRTLSDKLGAVQATAIYHYTSNNGELPVAVIATTVHPGTAETLKQSATFSSFNNLFPGINTTGMNVTGNDIAVDLFNGKGTNGVEFDLPSSYSSFSTALTNLAYFAGDPDGAFPAKQIGAVTHPYPRLTQWGDFSNLRRVTVTNPGDTSIAAQSYRHTAALTLGMLAYNVRYLSGFSYANNLGQLTALDNILKNPIGSLYNGTLTDGEIVRTGSIVTVYPDGFNASTQKPSKIRLDSADQPTPPEAYIAALPTATQNWARLFNTKEQVKRDRLFGFAPSPGSQLSGAAPGAPLPIAAQPDKYQYTLQFIGEVPVGDPPETYQYGGRTYTKTGDDTSTNGYKTLNIGCDFSNATGNNYFGYGLPTDKDSEKRFIRLATSLCSAQPKYSALYYVFPATGHGEVAPQAGDRATDPYIPGTSTTYSAFDDGALAAIALKPKQSNASWTLPYQANPSLPSYCPTSAAPNCSQYNLIQFNGTLYRVAFKDSALFDGREAMSVRALNVDMDLLRGNAPSNNRPPGAGSETWLPAGAPNPGNPAATIDGGVVYAFREDAVREDGIARPIGSRMDATASPSAPGQDPQITSPLGISTKPVDPYPDPDRRPHGFRLKNGRRLDRAVAVTDDTSGLSFVSDNSVYIQGDFNFHSNNTNRAELNIQNNLEEFEDTLETNWSDFYDRDRPNTSFAKPATDSWRPAEILADAVSILSDAFCDGSIEDGIINLKTANPSATTLGLVNRYGCNADGQYTSYLTLNRPFNTGFATTNTWMRETAELNSPIQITPTGNPRYIDSAGATQFYNGTYAAFGNGQWSGGGGSQEKRTPLAAIDTRVNASLISGIIPSRQNQTNGGFHNFPRMLQDWGSSGASGPGPIRNLTISGSFLQLNFSTSATGLFDQQAWDAGQSDTNSGSTSFYYYPPNRLWGYDVGLQFAPAGPVASRFVTAGSTRSEFYKELPFDDPYIQRLYNCALNNNCSS